MPPAVVLTIEYDPVRDEGEKYAERLRSAGTLVKSARIPGMVHHFSGPDALPTFFSLINELLSEIDAK